MILYTKDDKQFIVGSNAFFKCYEDFNPHDNDKLILANKMHNNSKYIQIRLNGNCIFVWKYMKPEEFISYHKQKNVAGMYINKFLVSDFVKEINFTINDLKQLNFLLDKLDKKHEYLKIIYDSYIENNDFYLTDKQRLNAYIEYKKERESK